MAAADGRCPLWRPCLGGGGTSTTCTMPTMDLHAANIASASCCSACAGTCTSQQPATGFGAELQKFAPGTADSEALMQQTMQHGAGDAEKVVM